MKPLYTKRYEPLVSLVIFFSVLCLCVLFYGKAYSQEAGKDKAVQLLKSAEGFYDEGDMEKALSAVREAMSAMPGNAGAYDRLGYILLKKGQFDDALNAFNEALKINPNLREAKTGTGLSLLGKGDLAGAEATLTAALALNPYPSMTHYALGLVYQKMNDDAKALSQFKEGLKTFKEGKK